jgi:hypothetical protein
MSRKSAHEWQAEVAARREAEEAELAARRRAKGLPETLTPGVRRLIRVIATIVVRADRGATRPKHEDYVIRAMGARIEQGFSISIKDEATIDFLADVLSRR